jgi:hypothetical protein
MASAADGSGGLLERGFELDSCEFLSRRFLEEAAAPAFTDKAIHGLYDLVS